MIDNIQSIMKKHLTQKEKIILSVTIAIWGVILIGSGLILNAQDRTITKTIYSLNISQKRVAQQRTNEIKLKKMEIEINTPLSVDVKDYLEDIDNLDEDIFAYLRLDTSTVKYVSFAIVYFKDSSIALTSIRLPVFQVLAPYVRYCI